MENLNDASTAAVETAAPEISHEESPRGSIDRAFEAAFADAPADQAKPTGEVEQASADRDENGRFKAKEAAQEALTDPVEQTTVQAETPAVDAPSRFSPDAKAEWDKTPAPVKAEIKRAFAEMEKGLSEYQAKWEPLKPYEDLAAQAGVPIHQAMSNYVNLEMSLQQDPIAGIQKIFDYVGINPRDYAAQVMGQTADQTASAQDTIIRELRNELNAMRQQIGSVSSTIEQQNISALQAELNQFAADKPRFEELRQSMSKLMTAGLANDLADAYAMADRLNPAPAAPAPQPKPDVTAQTRKASLSVTGAPASGSNPANRMPPSSARNAVDNAFARLGL